MSVPQELDLAVPLVTPVKARRVGRYLKAGLLLGVAIVGLLLVLNASPSADGPYTDTQTWESKTVNGFLFDRNYTVGVSKESAAEPGPAVIYLHALYGNRSETMGFTDMDYLGAANGIVTVWPQAMWGAWNSGDCCVPSSIFGVDDIGFLNTVFDEVAALPEVDPEEIYVAGMSAGGMMTARWVCETDRALAGAIAVAAVPLSVEGCEDRRTETMFAIGDEDGLFPYEGGWSFAGALEIQGPAPAVEAAVGEYAAVGGCGEYSEAVEVTDKATAAEIGYFAATRVDYTGCDAPVSLITMHSANHTWPFGGPWSPTKEMFENFDLFAN